MIKSKEILKLLEDNWSNSVETDYHSPDGLFTKSAGIIAKTLKNNSKNLKQSMSRLNFYINRAGSNLSKSTKLELEKAKDILRSLYV